MHKRVSEWFAARVSGFAARLGHTRWRVVLVFPGGGTLAGELLTYAIHGKFRVQKERSGVAKKSAKKKTKKKATKKTTAATKAKAPKKAKKAAAKKSKSSKTTKKKSAAKSSSAKPPAAKKSAGSKSATKTLASKSVTRADAEVRCQELGREIADRLCQRSPTMLDEAWWQDRMLQWAAWDDGIREQMYRFASTYPGLRGYKAVIRHLNEIYSLVAKKFGGGERLAPLVPPENSILGRALVWGVRRNVARLSSRFIAEYETDEQLAETLDELRSNGFAVLLNRIHADPLIADDADELERVYHHWLSDFQDETDFWPDIRQLDFNHAGAMARLPILIQAGQLEPLAFTDNDYPQRLRARITSLLEIAAERETSVVFDVLPCALEGMVRECLVELISGPFSELPFVGISVSADRANALDVAAEWQSVVAKRGTPIVFRVVEHRRRDEELIRSQYNSWTASVVAPGVAKRQFEELIAFAISHANELQPVICTHRLRPIALTLALAEAAELPTAAFEFEMPMGIGNDVARLLIEQGYRVRCRVSTGTKNAFALLAREMLRNPSCDPVVQDHLDLDKNIEELLMTPEETESVEAADAEEKDASTEFINEPLLDFSLAEERDALDAAVDDVVSQLGNDYALLINGRAEDGRAHLTSRNPTNPKQTVGTVAAASPDQASDAIEAAQRASVTWAKNSTKWRAEYVELIAAEMRNRRYELMAWCMLEAGMCRADANREVTTAIDFCMYYAWQIKRLDHVQQIPAPGESTDIVYRPRGVAVLMSPSSSPLAIPAGMTAAAIVTGNTAILKPAEEASVTAWQFADLCMTAGVPDGVINLLTGVGDEIGAALAGSPQTDIVAFAGTRTAGMDVNLAAAQYEAVGRSMKRVVSHFNGNNAAIVDDDVDLDTVVPAVLESAFAFSGQSCYRISRVIVVGDLHDDFLNRLHAVMQELKIGDPLKSESVIGPVLSAGTQSVCEDLLQVLQDEPDVEIVIHDSVPDKGQFVAPMVVSKLATEHPALEKEYAAPIMFVQQAADFDEAVRFANGYHSNLVAAVFSQSPANLDQARVSLRTGNLFLNRTTNGPMVYRHPFGGFQLSGSGVHAGGPSYLQEFLVPVAVTQAE